ncbi:MAG: ribonuclease III [Hyphomicrobiales bacterium]
MKNQPDADLDRLEDRLGHHFSDRDLLEKALTHMSAIVDPRDAGRTYQRLEFLGDRVLALAVADMLIEAFPDAEEGELARRLNHMVKAETCAEVALELDLGPYLRLGGGEAQSGGRRKKAILGDVCEAVIGAIYRDGGFLPAAQFVMRNWKDRMLGWSGPLRDPKTTLQEWAHGRGVDAPVYRLAGRSGPDHAPVFVVEAEVSGLAPESGSGTSKRNAEQAAARAFLVREGVWSEDHRG